MGVRVLLFGFLVLAMVAVGCNGDDDETAVGDGSDSTATSTTAAEPDWPPAIPPAYEIEARSTHQVGEPVAVDADTTLTVTGLEPDPELDREPSIPLADGDRYVLVRGTVDYTGTIEDDAIVSVGREAVLVPADPVESVAYPSRDNGCAEVHDDVNATVFPTETWEVGWCFAVPDDQSFWKLVLDPLASFGLGHPTNNATTDSYEYVWDVSI